ncbi:MAG TPA: ECF transporter S component [Oscillospiraceae bacterium]|nr:ECF transporter S component [Oscillospiraceae bacterium]HPS34424.1 ECF transporter S component [Oscillospiraceae bacterium]
MRNTKKLVLAALFVALGIVLPIAFHSIPDSGRIFLPMHIPVLLCGLVCGFPYGLACGIVVPVLSSLLTGMPPAAILPSMLFELAAYGTAASLLMRFTPLKNTTARIYISLIGAMISGRILFGILNALIFNAGKYSMTAWLASAFVTALPGIVIQIVFIPAIAVILQKAKLIELKQ